MTPEKNVAKIELYHTLALIFSQPEEVVNKYFSHNPHWWSCVCWWSRSHSIHWQDWIFQFFTMVCLVFHTVIIINRKNWRITTKLPFENLSIFFKSQTHAHARTTYFPSPSKYNLLDTELNSLFGGQTGYFIGLERHTKYIKTKRIQSLLNPANTLWKDIMLYWLKLILNSDQDLALSRQKLILAGLLITKIHENRKMNILLFSYSMLGYISPITSLPISIEEILVQPISFNPHTRLDFSIISPSNISDKFTITWNLCSFLQPCLIYSTIFCKKLDFFTANHNRYI